MCYLLPQFFSQKFSIHQATMGRVIRFQPFLHSLWLLLKGPLQRPLRRETPAGQVATYRSDRYINQEALLDVGPDSVGIPQRKAQFHLIGRLIHNVFADAILLLRRQHPDERPEARVLRDQIERL